MTQLVTAGELHRAAAGTRTTCLRTPVLPVPHPAGGGPVWVKAESLQRTGSFKLRGARYALGALDEVGRAGGVVTYSAGNHGRALAHAAGVDHVVVVPVGGGGLVAGVAAAVKSLRRGVRVIAAEPALAGDLAEGYAAGERAVWSRELTGRTIADGLRAPAVGELAWAHITALVDDVVTVTEDSIVAAMRWLAGSAKLVVEPSGAVAAAALLEHAHLMGRGPAVAIATGGNVDLATFATLVAGGRP